MASNSTKQRGKQRPVLPVLTYSSSPVPFNSLIISIIVTMTSSYSSPSHLCTNRIAS